MSTMEKKKIPKLNIFSENILAETKIDERKFINLAKKILIYYLSLQDVKEKSCLSVHKYNTLSFDILYCSSEKTHQINKDYRQKDYPADIITFAIFADTPSAERFIFDGEINLGEIIIALDKTANEAQIKNVSFEHELAFLISHGILHLLGFDHQTEEEYNLIIELQQKALELAGI